MVKSNFEKQFTANKSDKAVGFTVIIVVTGCFLAVLIALVVKFIQWLFS